MTIPPESPLQLSPHARLQRLQVPVPLLRYHQAMPEQGPAACHERIGVAPPQGHIRFPSTSL